MNFSNEIRQNQWANELDGKNEKNRKNTEIERAHQWDINRDKRNNNERKKHRAREREKQNRRNINN